MKADKIIGWSKIPGDLDSVTLDSSKSRGELVTVVSDGKSTVYLFVKYRDIIKYLKIYPYRLKIHNFKYQRL